MKKIVLSFLTIITVSSFFFACSVPWDMGDDLDKLEEVVYMGGGDIINGHNTMTLNFVDETFTFKYFTFDYATDTAETSGTYEDKSWYQNNGSKGSFTYDNDTRLLSTTVLEVYKLKDSAETEYSADYEWHTLVEADETAEWADECIKSSSGNALLTQDGMLMAYVGSDTDGWVCNYSETYVDGSTKKGSIAYSISATSFEYTSSRDEAEKNATVSEISHRIKTSTYTVNNFFLVGEETGDMEFSEVWKENNTVTFQVEKTKDTELNYTGAAAPESPTPDPTTGYAETGTEGVDYAFIDLSGGFTYNQSFMHMEDCIVDSYYLMYAVRGLE